MASAHDGTKELRILVGILVGLIFAVVMTAWTDAGAQTRARAAAPSPDPAMEVVETDLYFDKNSTRLKAEAAKILQEQVTMMMNHGTSWVVILTGHADRHGAPEYNRDLAKRRATTVKQFLMDLGVPDTSVAVIAAGHEGGEMNRRVHMEIRRMTEGIASPTTTR